MKVAIIYISRHGTTLKVVEYITQKLNQHDVMIYNLNDRSKIDLSLFDTVVIGGSVHAGKLNHRLKRFLSVNTLMLLQKRLALLMCGTNEAEFETTFQREFPELLRHHAIACECVGGELLFEKMNFIEAFMVRRIAGIKTSFSKINHEAIDRLVAKISIKTDEQLV